MTEAEDAEVANHSTKGFQFTRVDEETAEQIAEFLRLLEEGVWEKAFKGYADLRTATRGRLTPIGDQGRYLPVHRLMAERLESIPTPGRAAFRQYFDAYAAELLAGVENHAEPGSYEQFRLARELFDWFALTSSGPRAGELLGDLCYERGRYLEAAESWGRVLSLHPGSRPEASLQARRALALLRAGDQAGAERLYEGLTQRYGGLTDPAVRLGGQDVGVTRYLREQFARHHEAHAQRLAQGPATVRADHAPAALPQPGTEPGWVFTIVTPAVAKRMQATPANHWGYVNSMQSLIPPVAVDDQRVYGHWMGSVFALDLRSGKLLWQTLAFNLAAQAVRPRNEHHNNHDDYRIALTDDAVLVVDAAPSDRSGMYILTAYDKQTGRALWDTAGSLYERSVCGEPLLHDGQLYITTRPRNLASGRLLLHQLDPATGEVGWSIALGDMDLQQSPYAMVSPSIQPVLRATDRHVLVLTNNGGLLAVDAVAGEVSWAFKLESPAHLEDGENFIHARAPDQGTMPDTAPGGLLVRGTTIYFKESLSRRAYALDLDDQAARWTRRIDSLYAELAGASDDRLVLTANGVDLLGTDGEFTHALDANNIGMPSSNVLVGQDAVYLLTNGQVVRAAMKPPYARATFQSRHLHDNEGGRLYAADGLLICVSKTGLVAYPTPTQTVQTQDNTP